MRPIAIASANRSALLPDVPTASETLAGYEFTQRYGIIAPAHTPREIVMRLNAALNEALTSEDVKSRIAADGADTAPSSPEIRRRHRSSRGKMGWRHQATGIEGGIDGVGCVNLLPMIS